MRDVTKAKICIIGLGYVGLPLAIEFGKRYRTLGFDLDDKRINSLRLGRDITLEVSARDIKSAKRLTFTTDKEHLKGSDIFIVTVPTPIDKFKRPDLSPLLRASESIGASLRKGNIVIYESTVYPGCTEEVCVPVLEKASGLIYNKDFFCGYSPERINPGDKSHRLSTIKKITSGSNPKTAETVNDLYSSVITAGTHKASSIRVAEAAKVIENTQRDVNIALINELAVIFNRLGIDTEEVLAAAGTKWNFLPFRPGLVGGHCIGVDPYYLTHKSAEIGYHPEMILAGRRINDGMGRYIAHQVIKLMGQNKLPITKSRILVMGLTFKENCPDIRNSKAMDIVDELRKFELQVDIYDPWVNRKQAHLEYGIRPIKTPSVRTYDAIVLAVSHDSFKLMGPAKIRTYGKKNHVLYDVKYLFPPTDTDGRL